MNSAAAPCGARAVLLPWKISAEAAKPVSILPISKPAFRTHSAQQASSRASSVIVAALYPFWPRQALKSSTCGASQRSRSATFCGFLRLYFAIMIPSVSVEAGDCRGRRPSRRFRRGASFCSLCYPRPTQIKRAGDHRQGRSQSDVGRARRARCGGRIVWDGLVLRRALPICVVLSGATLPKPPKRPLCRLVWRLAGPQARNGSADLLPLTAARSFLARQQARLPPPSADAAALRVQAGRPVA